MFSSLPGIFLKVTNVLKISESGKVHSDSEGYQWTDSGSDSGIGMGLLGTSGGGGGGSGGKGGSGLSASGKGITHVFYREFHYYFSIIDKIAK